MKKTEKEIFHLMSVCFAAEESMMNNIKVNMEFFN